MVHLAYKDPGILCTWVLNILSTDMKFPWGNFLLENVLKISTDFFCGVLCFCVQKLYDLQNLFHL